MALLDEERREWKQHPVTQELLGLLRESQQETMLAWANGVFVGDTAELTLAANTAALGGIKTLNQIVSLIEDMGSEE